MIFPMLCNTQILASLAKFWHQLGRTKGSRDKEVNSGTDKGEAEMKEGEDFSQRNEMDNKEEGPEWSTICYATDIC